MDARELIQVNLQLPAGALDSLARLTEQLRLLAAAAGGQEQTGTRQTLERGENRFFDPEQFRALRQDTEMAEVEAPLTAGHSVGQMPEMETVMPQIPDGTPEMETVTVQASDGIPEADAVRPEMRSDVDTPKDACRKVGQKVEDPAQAGPPAGDAPADAETVTSDTRDGPSAETIQQDADSVIEEIPTVQTESHPVPGPEAVRMEPESQIQEAERVWEQVETPDYAPSSVQAGVSEEVAAPVNAGFVLAMGPDMPRSRWTSGSEMLAAPGGVSLTAEDVSLAFQRDGRRYDNGFPLY